MKSIPAFKKIEWDRYAVRQYSLFYWSAILYGYKHYQDFVKNRFAYLMVKYTPTDRVYFRDKKKRMQMEQFLEKNISRIQFVENFVGRVEKISDSAVRLNKNFCAKKFPHSCNKKLLKEFRHYFRENSPWVGAISSMILLMGKLFDFIQNDIVLPKLKEKGKEKQVNQVMGRISSPKKAYYQQEELELIEIGLEKSRERLERLLQKHVKKYGAMHYFNTHRLWTKKDFLERISELKKKGLQKERKKILAFLKRQDNEVKKVVKDLKLSKKEARYIDLLRTLLFLRAQEEYLLSQIEFSFYSMFKETALHFPVSVNQLKFFTVQELFNLLEGKKVDLAQVNARKEFALLLFKKEKQFVLAGKKAEKIFKTLVKESAPKKFSGILKGTTAMKGKTKGKAKIILHVGHLQKFNKGDILVAPNTNPAYVVAMKKASAIVTDEGGITCHAAIVSRELGVPCVIGTKYATTFLKDNDLIEVNATEGLIQKVKK